MAFPIRPVQPPAVLAGQTNGKLDPALLVDTPGQAGGPVVRLVSPAARAWRALAAAALADGHTLKATSRYDSYRPYAVQRRIFLERYSLDPQPSGLIASRLWDSDGDGTAERWWRLPNVATAAVPGTSNHGWGLAVDTGEERDGDAGTESIDLPTVAWLTANEERFGYSHELQSEPWHIRYWAGDLIPPAVLAYEKGLEDMTPEQATQLKDIWYATFIVDSVNPRPVGSIARKIDDIHLAAGIDVDELATAIVAKLPPSTLTAADVQAACELAVRAVAADAATP